MANAAKLTKSYLHVPRKVPFNGRTFLGQQLYHVADKYSDNEMYVFCEDNERISFKQKKESRQFAASLLSKGLKKGDRKALLGFRHSEWLIAFFACAQLGILPVALRLEFPVNTLSTLLKKLKCKAILLTRSPATLVETMHQLMPELQGGMKDQLFTSFSDLQMIIYGDQLQLGGTKNSVSSFLEIADDSDLACVADLCASFDMDHPAIVYFTSEAPGQDDVIVIDADKRSNSNDDLWAWSIDDQSNDDKKGHSSDRRRHEGSHSRESSRRRSRSRERRRSRKPRSRRRSRSPPRHSGRSRSPRRKSRSRSPSRRSRSPHRRSRSPRQSASSSSSQKPVASSSYPKPKKTQAPAEDVKNAWQGAAATLRMLTSDAASSGSELDVTEVREKSSSPEIEEVLQVEGFVHNMTPIKLGKNNKYFYAILQVSQKDYINMVCLGTDQHQMLMSMARNKGALKFTNITFNKSRTGSGGKDVTVNSRTQVSKTPVKFHATKPFWSHLANFCSLKNAETRVNEGDHIHVAVTVQSCNNKAVEQVVRGNEVERKDYVITDKSGSITLSTWGEYTEILQIGKTYMVGNVTVKVHKGVKVLNTNIRTSIIEGIWDRKKHELDYTVVFPSMYPEDGGNSLEAQKKSALQTPGGPGRGLLGHSPGRSPRDSGRSSAGGGYYYGASQSQFNPYQNYPQQWGSYQQNYYGGSS